MIGRIIVSILLLTSINSFSQYEFSTDFTLKGYFIGTKIYVPVNKKFSVGVKQSYNLTSRDVRERTHIFVNYTYDRSLNVEAGFGYLNQHAPEFPTLLKFSEKYPDYKINVYLVMNILMDNNFYFVLGTGTGLFKIGLNYRINNKKKIYDYSKR